MNKKEVLTEFEELSKKFGIDVQYEFLEGKGGLCSIKDKKLIIINKALPDLDKVKIFSEIFSNFPLDNVYLKPALRKYIENSKKLSKTVSSKTSPLTQKPQKENHFNSGSLRSEKPSNEKV
jgi:hypothetical protein